MRQQVRHALNQQQTGTEGISWSSVAERHAWAERQSSCFAAAEVQKRVKTQKAKALFPNKALLCSASWKTFLSSIPERVEVEVSTTGSEDN